MFLCIVNNIVAYNSNGYMTKYTYSPTGEKLRVTHQTAVPNITVPIGSTRELAPYEIQYADSTDYLLGGSLTLKNGRIDRLLFEEGYCQAESYVNNSSQDVFTFCYYDRDHLGNIRQVTEADGTSTGNVIQTMNYYPFGTEFCDGTANSSVQPYKYNGKEFDGMHGLNTYDYGARQYNPVTAHWDRVDPLCEKYYSLSPYNYCGNNPIKYIDPDGMWPWPWERGSLIEYRGNGVFGLRIGNFSKTTQSNFYAANSNPHKWAYREIGLNTELGCISIHHYGHEAYSPSRKLPGIDPQNGNIRIRRPTAVSTGQEDRRFHQFPPTFAKGRGGAGVILALDAAIGVTDTFLTLSTFWDIEGETWGRS